MHINNGYECVHQPKHPAARPNGYVYKHRLVMENKIGRYLLKTETVHHKDGNRLNNDADNLEIVSNKNHAHIHKGYKKTRVCKVCGKETVNESFCSDTCSYLSQRKVARRPTKEELARMLWIKPVSAIARDYGVSDACIKKWCRRYSISNFPGRGYWQKKQAGLI